MKRGAIIAIVAGMTLFGIVGLGGTTQAKVSGPNGRIVFIRSDPLGNNRAYTVNPDGTHEQLLLDGDAAWARWSPSGTEIDVRHTDAFAATIVDPDTGTFRDLSVPDPIFTCTPTTTPEECGSTDFSCPAWSPDATRLACDAYSGVDPSRDGIYTIRSSDGGGLTLIKSCPPACGGIGDYSPDGKRLVFVGPDQNGQLRIFVIKLNGTGLTPLTPPGMSLNDEVGGSWSPQGDQILFTARPAPDHRFAIWVVKTDGTGLHQVPTSCGGASSDPTSVGCPEAAWSPDGTKIAFSRINAMGNQRYIYTVNVDGSGLSKVTNSGFQDSSPDWGTRPLSA